MPFTSAAQPDRMTGYINCNNAFVFHFLNDPALNQYILLHSIGHKRHTHGDVQPYHWEVKYVCLSTTVSPLIL